MTTPELPPLPDPFVTAGLPQSGVLAHGYSAKQMHAYAEAARADEFNRGARAMFDHIMARAANCWHTDPKRDKACQYDRELMEEIAENALNEVSPESCQAWRSINDAMESARAPLVAEVEKMRQTIAWLRGLIATVVERMEREDGPGPDAPGHCHEKPGVWDADNRREIAGKPCEWCHIWSEFKAAGAGKVETCDWCWKSVAEHGNG